MICIYYAKSLRIKVTTNSDLSFTHIDLYDSNKDIKQ